MTKSEYLLGLLDSTLADLGNRSQHNAAISVVKNIRDQVAARQLLSEDPDESKLENSYSAISAEINRINAITLTIPTLEEVTEGLSEAESASEGN